MTNGPSSGNSLTGDETLDLPEFDNPPTEPIGLLSAWLDNANGTVLEPLAATLATSSPEGGPSSRTVLVKGVEADGTIIVTTSLQTRKGRELDGSRRAALTFYWRETMQQINITGDVARVDDEAAQSLFARRPIDAQAASSVSEPGQPLDDESAMTQRAREVAQSQNIARPDSWGGYRIRPDVIEFWHGRATRLHRRLLFQRKESSWTSARLQP